MWVKALDVEAVLGVGIQVRDDSAACCHICHYVSLVLVRWRIITLEVDQEAIDGNTLFWMVLHHKDSDRLLRTLLPITNLHLLIYDAYFHRYVERVQKQMLSNK